MMGNKNESLRSINFMGFKGMGRSSGLFWGARRLPLQQSVATPSGYPLAGCSPAEPASVSPDMF